MIGADEVQWMTAGSGLMHQEFMTAEFARAGGIQHAVQLWVNLPQKDKMTPPRYQALTKENIPEVLFDGGKIRVIAGNLKMKNPEGILTQKSGMANTFSPVELYDVRFETSGNLELSIEDGYTTLVLVVDGSILIDGQGYSHGEIVYFSRSGSDIRIVSEDSAKVLIMA